MTLDKLHNMLEEAVIYDWMFDTEATTENGMKISIQGKSIEDSVFLFDKLEKYLRSNNIPFKVATAKRFALRERKIEQSHKAMTIYCIDGMDFNELCEDIYNLSIDYKGWHDIKTPTSYTHYAGGLFFRNDRDSNGNYIPAN